MFEDTAAALQHNVNVNNLQVLNKGNNLFADVIFRKMAYLLDFIEQLDADKIFFYIIEELKYEETPVY